MTPIEALHTAARRYCIDQSAYWHRKYGEGRVAPNNEEAHAIFPRYHVFEVILDEVERKMPEDFPSFDEAKSWLLLAGEVAQSYFTQIEGLQKGVAQIATTEERARFQGFVQGFTTAQTGGIEPLHYHRTISAEESRTAWADLAEQWGVVDCYWYPLSGDAPPHTIAVYAYAFDTAFGTESLRSLLAELGVTRVFSLNESMDDTEYETDLVLLDTRHKVLEEFWTPFDREWVIYASHENSLTFAGERLVEALKARWTEWDKYLWHGFNA